MLFFAILQRVCQKDRTPSVLRCKKMQKIFHDDMRDIDQKPYSVRDKALWKNLTANVYLGVDKIEQMCYNWHS